MDSESENVEDNEEDSANEESAEASTAEEAQSEDDKSTEADYASMTVAELKELLKAAGKPVSGKKADLVARLQE